MCFFPLGQALLYNARKVHGPTATGAVGVLSYYIPHLNKTLAVLFSVPFDYNLYDNWWNVKLYSGDKEASYDMYYEMYHNADPFQGDDGWKERDLGSGLKVKGSMASSGHTTLILLVKGDECDC